MIDTAAHIFLKFGHVDVILAIIICGILFHRRDYYGTAACFVCFVMIFNKLLKDFFKVPLFPHLGNGYAFPSGHMHAAAAFYGYICYKTSDYKIKIAIIILLGCIGFSLVHCHFHDWFDVGGALLFAALEISLLHFLKNRFGLKFIAIIAVFLSCINVSVLYFFYEAPSHVWYAFCLLIGFTAFMKICDRSKAA
ncbi:hypothetical protein FACS189472_16720 [Alphaproteobacteria bacterium]|nr:hypothetical protein FACS189472_16720 [Alphaproteobacteria bacterium]